MDMTIFVSQLFNFKDSANLMVRTNGNLELKFTETQIFEKIVQLDFEYFSLWSQFLLTTEERNLDLYDLGISFGMLNFLIDDVKINDPLNIFGLNKPKQNVQNNEMANEKEQLIDNQKDLIENQKNEEFVGLEELSKKINLHTQEDIKLNSNESNNKENSNKEQYEK